MRVLITGGAGYIGSVLVEKILAETDWHVTVLDNLTYRQTSLIHHSHNRHFDFWNTDVSNIDKLQEILSVTKPDVIIPLAAFVGAPACEKVNETQVNDLNYWHVEACSKYAKFNHIKIVYPNTNSGYGVGQVKDGELTYCDENSPLNPLSLYGSTKVEAEREVVAVGGVSLRLATVFGVSPRMRLDLLVNDFTYRSLSDKFVVLYESHFKRNYIHVRDVANAFIFAIKNYDKMSGQVFNLGLSSANLSKMELCLKIKEFVPSFSIMEDKINSDPDKRNYVISNDKIEALGWHPEYTIEDGITEIMKAFSALSNSNTRFNNL